MKNHRIGWRIRRETLGTPPGSLVSSDTGESTTIHTIIYTADSVEEHEFRVEPGGTIPELPSEPKDGVRWINVIGVHDGDLIRGLGDEYGMHVLQMEDVQHTDQRPKFQATNNGFFAVVRMTSALPGRASLDIEQVALFSTGGTVISFQEREGDVFDPIRARIRGKRGRLRKLGGDYLLYAIIDAIIDATFLVVDHEQERIEDLEEQIMAAPGDVELSSVHSLRGEIVAVRRSTWPLREMFQFASRGDYEFFSETTGPFLADGYDHVLALIDLIDAQVDRATGLFQLHASMMSASTNEVMRVLTIIATIFIPLTFMAGIYGMNFAWMPELQWRWGYFSALGAMGTVAVGMVIFFRRRKWF